MTASITRVFVAPIAHPNGLAASEQGLWMVDQQTQEVALADWNDGRELHRAQTESENSSGLAFDGAHLWVACNGMTAEHLDGANKAVLKVDPNTGATLARFPIPLDPLSGVHGLECAHGTVWVTSLRARRLAQVRADTWELVHTIPFDHSRAHGLAWDDGCLWCVETNDRAVYKLDATDGRVLQTIEIPMAHPEPHGLTIFGGALWYCDANTGEVCRIE